MAHWGRKGPFFTALRTGRWAWLWVAVKIGAFLAAFARLNCSSDLRNWPIMSHQIIIIARG